MKRLHEQDPRLDYLTDHDRRVLRTIRKESSGWYGEESYWFDVSRTIPALIGHPGVFDARERDRGSSWWLIRWSWSSPSSATATNSCCPIVPTSRLCSWRPKRRTATASSSSPHGWLPFRRSLGEKVLLCRRGARAGCRTGQGTHTDAADPGRDRRGRPAGNRGLTLASRSAPAPGRGIEMYPGGAALRQRRPVLHRRPGRTFRAGNDRWATAAG